VKKNILSLIFICMFFFVSFFNLAFATEDSLHGRAEKSQAQVDSKNIQGELFTGHHEKLGRKDVLIMTVSQVLDGSYSKENDEFFAEVSNDVEGNNGMIIPSGTIAHGRIKQVAAAKRFGRDGALDLSFDYLITPDGREIAIDGKMTTRLHPAVAMSKIFGTDLGYTASGALVGGFFALNYFGLGQAIASQGSTVAGGAALGGTLGLGVALYRKGENVLISPGDEIRVKINTAATFPVYKKTAFLQHELSYEGLDVKINDIIYEKDLFGEVSTITLSLAISNMTQITFSIFDLALINDYKSVYYPSVFSDTNAVFKELKPGECASGKVSFSVDNVKNKFWLVFYDHKNKKAIAEISLANAYREISDKSKKQNDNSFKKTNPYCKEENPFNSP